MKKFTDFVFKFRMPIIIATILITLILGYFIKDLKINADVISSLPKSDPAVQLFNYIGEEYGGNQMAIIVLESDDIFKKETIANINNLTAKFKGVEGVSYVTSLTNVLDIKKTDDGLEIGRLIDEYKLPETAEELEHLKKYTLSKEMYRGRLVSKDGQATVLVCRLNDDVDRVKTTRQLREITQSAELQEKVYYGGLPFQLLDLQDLIVQDLKTLIPLVVLLIAGALALSFLSIRGVVLPMLSVLISTIWTMGCMSILKIPLTVVSDLIPVILVAVGSASAIHIISKYDEDHTRYGNTGAETKSAFSEVGLRVILAAATIIFGFTSFIFGSYLTMIREFGLFSALGVLFSLIISVSVIPAILSFIKIRDVRREKTGKPAIVKLMDWLGLNVLKHEKAIIIVCLVLMVVGALGIPQIKRKADLMDFFKPNSPIRLTEKMMKSKFGGSMPIQIVVQGDIQDPVVLNEMIKLEDYLESQGDATNPQSVADLIEEMSDVMGEGKKIPDNKDKVANLWFLLDGQDEVRQLVNDDKTEAIIQATVTNSERMPELVKAVETYINKIDSNHGKFVQTGFPLIYQHLDESIMSSQIESFAYALILIFILLAFQLRSFVGGLIGLAPIVFAVMMAFGVMGFAHIPLDVATVLVSSIAMGIGIDYSIHFSVRFKSFYHSSATTLEALDKTLETTGRAIIINMMTVALGFLALILCSIVPLQRFGILVAVTMISSGIGAVTFLPALILLTKAGFMGKPKGNGSANEKEKFKFVFLKEE